jgi:hypothetical protein
MEKSNIRPNINKHMKRHYDAAKAVVQLFFEHSPTGMLFEPSGIPFEDDVEVVPTHEDDPFLRYDMGLDPHPQVTEDISYLPIDHPVSNRSEHELRWDSLGDYTDRSL